MAIHSSVVGILILNGCLFGPPDFFVLSCNLLEPTKPEKFRSLFLTKIPSTLQRHHSGKVSFAQASLWSNAFGKNGWLVLGANTFL